MSTIDSVEANSRLGPVMRGVKEGAVKEIVNKIVNAAVEPMMNAIGPKFVELFPNGSNLLEPAVRAGLEFVVIMGFAELAAFAGPMAYKVLPNANQDDMVRKSQLIATWMRKNAGERIGEQLVNAAVVALPLIMDQFKSVETNDLADLLGEPIVATKPAVEPEVAKS